MSQRDYILRMIEQAGVVLKALLDRMRGGDASREDTRLELKRAAHLGNLDFDLLRILDANAVRMMVSQVGQADPARIWLAAETLYLDGVSALDETPAEGEASLAKALMLYRMVEPTVKLPGGFPEVFERIAEIERLLTGAADDLSA